MTRYPLFLPKQLKQNVLWAVFEYRENLSITEASIFKIKLYLEIYSTVNPVAV